MYVDIAIYVDIAMYVCSNSYCIILVGGSY